VTDSELRLIDRRAFWSGLDSAAAPLAALAIAFGLLRLLGVADYGVLIIALAVSGLSMAITPALAATTTKLVAEGRAAGEGSPAVARLVTASLMLALTANVLLLAIAASFKEPLAHLVFGPEAVGRRSDLGGVLILAVLAVCVQQLDGVLAAAIRGLERFRLQASLEVIARLGTVVIVLVVARWTMDVQLILVAYCVSYVASAAVRGQALRKLVRQPTLLVKPTREELRSVLSFGGWMWLNALANIAYLNVDRIIVGRMLGAAAAGEFSIFVQVAQLVHYVPASLFAFSLPVFSRLNAAGASGAAELQGTYRRTALSTALIAVCIALPAVMFGNDLLRILSSGTLQAREPAFSLLVGSFFLLTFSIAPFYLLLGAGRSKAVSILTAASSAVALIATAFMTPHYGLTGAALARFGYVCGVLLLIPAAIALLRTLRSRDAAKSA
jgi:O-antigen/teichoic acid export membrane protein